MLKIAAILLLVGISATINAQVAAPSSVKITPDQLVPAEPKPSPTPIPDVPALSTLDQAFNRTSIGKDADEARQRVEIRQLQNKIADDLELVEMKKSAEAAGTDLEKRERLREFYRLYYARLRVMTSDPGTRKAIADEEAEHLKLLDQPRVRPVPGGTIPPIAKKEKGAKKKKSRLGQALSQH